MASGTTEPHPHATPQSIHHTHMPHPNLYTTPTCHTPIYTPHPHATPQSIHHTHMPHPNLYTTPTCHTPIYTPHPHATPQSIHHTHMPRAHPNLYTTSLTTPIINQLLFVVHYSSFSLLKVLRLSYMAIEARYILLMLCHVHDDYALH